MVGHALICLRRNSILPSLLQESPGLNAKQKSSKTPLIGQCFNGGTFNDASMVEHAKRTVGLGLLQWWNTEHFVQYFNSTCIDCMQFFNGGTCTDLAMLQWWNMY